MTIVYMLNHFVLVFSYGVQRMESCCRHLEVTQTVCAVVYFHHVVTSLLLVTIKVLSFSGRLALVCWVSASLVIVPSSHYWLSVCTKWQNMFLYYYLKNAIVFNFYSKIILLKEIGLEFPLPSSAQGTICSDVFSGNA